MTETDFFEACKRGDLLLVEQLLQDARVDPSASDNCAIRWAAEDGHSAVVERLLQDERVNPAADDNYVIRWAARKGHLAVFERLLQDKRVDPAADDNFAIHKAIARDQHATVDRLYQDVRVYAVWSQSSSQVLFPHLSMFKSRMLQVCIALQSVDLPALLLLKIIDRLIPNTVTMHAKWQLITTVKHFHQRYVKNIFLQQ